MSDEMQDVIAAAMADSAGAAAQVDDNKVSLVSTLALKQKALEAKKKKLEDDLKQCDADLLKVKQHDLPNAMLELGSRGFTLEDGSSINIKKVYAANVKADNKFEAFNWLIDRGHEALIKTVVGLDVGKGQVELAEEIQALITKYLAERAEDEDKRTPDGLVPAIDQSIHWQTLRAFVKEQIETEQQAINDGEPIEPDNVLPRELFGVHIIDQAEITLPKTKKK